jgi:hypothetical protein
MYSFDDLKKRSTEDPPNVDTELALGLVSFNATVIMKGPGNKSIDGVNLVKLGWVQDIIDTSVQIFYDNKGYAQFAPNPSKGPWLDSARNKWPYNVNPGTGGDTAFTRSSTEQRPTDAPGGGKSAVVVSLDAPGITFLATNPKINKGWSNTAGSLYFSNNVTAYISDAPSIYDWLGSVPWSVNYVGHNRGGTWLNNGSGVYLHETISQTSILRTPIRLPFVTDEKVKVGGLGEFNAIAPTFVAATGGYKFKYYD